MDTITQQNTEQKHTEPTQTHKHTNTQTHKRTTAQTHKHTTAQTQQPHKQTNALKHTQTDTHIDTHAQTQTNKQTDQTKTQTHETDTINTLQHKNPRSVFTIISTALDLAASPNKPSIKRPGGMRAQRSE